MALILVRHTRLEAALLAIGGGIGAWQRPAAFSEVVALNRARRRVAT